MSKDKLIVLLVFVFCGLGLIGIQFIPDPSPAGPAAKAHKSPQPPHQTYRGISLQLHSPGRDDLYRQYIDEIASTGANTVCLVVTSYQENCSSASIFVDLRKTPADSALEALMEHAHRRGLAVFLMPIVLLENPRAGEWRGKINPPNWDDWWEDYENYIMHYAYLAESGQAEVFMVGSELVSTEANIEKWEGLIRRVRDAYRGKLSYSANWDHYRPIKWWDKLDLIGMTTYYDLSGGLEPTVERLVESWKPIKEEILAWQADIALPIVFTEVGWPNQVTCAQYPWDYYRSIDQPDPSAQANCFEAFFRTWTGQDQVAGFLVWEWRNHPGQVTDPAKDTSYVPCEKPAMNVIRKYYSGDLPEPETFTHVKKES